MAKQARAAMKAKAQRLGGDRPTEKVDSSTFTPPELLNSDVKTGMRPISRRAYKSGGKVQGAKGPANMGKAPRSGSKPMTADSMVNKDMKEANQEREGIKHIGGLKSGGRTKKMGGGPLPASIGNAQAMMDRAKATSSVPITNLGSQTRPGSNRFKQATGLKKGGAAKHDDVKEDKALIKKMVKSEARTGKDDGGEIEGDEGYKKGGRAKKLGGGASVYDRVDAARARRGDYASPDQVESGRQSAMSSAERALGMKPDEAPDYKKGGRAKRATGGGVFDGPGYPGKVPGVVPGGRTAHARGGKAGKSRGKGKTNINIVIASGKPAGPGDMMGNPMGGPTSPPGMDGMPGGMPIAVPPPAGGPPGGAPMPMPIPIPMPGPAGPAGPPGMPMPRKSGGRAYRSYEDIDAGAGSGKGRLEKAEIAESKRSARKVGGRTYSSYKDMDAGSGGGFGRLEKAEIASKTARIEKGNY
jgi:hypothetical protein